MKITLLTVGKTDKDWVRQGMDIYVSRMKHYFPFSVIEIPELKNVSALSEEQIKVKEGELILKNLRPTDDVILLDEPISALDVTNREIMKAELKSLQKQLQSQRHSSLRNVDASRRMLLKKSNRHHSHSQQKWWQNLPLRRNRPAQKQQSQKQGILSRKGTGSRKAVSLRIR